MLQLIDKQSDEIQQLLYDVPALFTLYALNHDGHITDKEERKAAQILHVETYTGLTELKDYFNRVEYTYIERLHFYDNTLSTDNNLRHEEIKEILHRTKAFFENIDKKKMDNFASAINTFVNAVVKSNKNLMSDFTIPIFNQYLENVNKILFREVVGLPLKK